MNDKTIKILLIEDNAGDIRLIREMLTEAKYIAFDLECVDRLSTGLERNARGDIDIILLDLGLPDSQGLDTFNTINDQTSKVPIIVLTAFEDDAWAIKAVRNGAQDYLVKGKVDSTLLVRTIRYALERKKAEAELQKARDTLEIKVMERTEELHDANIRLKELGSLKNAFISSMSHELRTPLNSIIGFTGIMLQGMTGELTGEQRRQLTIVKKSGDHLLALISDVIDVSRIEANHIELDVKEFDFSDMVRDVRDSFKVAIDEKGLKLVLEVPEKLMVESDERRMKQVIMNLVSNAVKFTDEGAIEIQVVEVHGTVEVAVEDTGIGLKDEDMTRLFKQFSRILVEGRQIEKGTGLGLYISKKVSELLGGEVKVESTFGVGSTFTVVFPLRYGKVKR
jgi:signal transduction histidine kinase